MEIDLTPIFTTHAHERGVTGCCFDCTGRKFLSVGYDGKLVIREAPNWNQIRETSCPQRAVIAAGRSSSLYAMGGLSENIVLYDIDTGQPVRRVNGSASAWSICLFGNDTKIGSVRLCASDNYPHALAYWQWDLSRRRIPERPIVQASQDRGVWFSEDGTLSAIANGSGALRISDASLAGAHNEWHAHDIGCQQAAFGPNCDWIASVGVDGYLRVWQLETGEIRAEYRHPSVMQAPYTQLICVDVSPDGRLIGIGSMDGQVTILRVRVLV